MKVLPLLSVIVPVYNTERVVEKCINSLIEQTYKNIEIIVVDDCSPGNISEIITSYQEKYKNIKFIQHDKNRGLYQARITGLEAAEGDFFTFVDSDDWIGIDTYRVMIKKALEVNADIVATDRLEVMEDGTYYSPHDMLQQVDWDLKETEIIDTLMKQRGLDYGWWLVWNKIYACQIWKDTKKILKSQEAHLIMCEDVAFSTAFFSAAKHFSNIHYNYYYYYRGSSSSTFRQCTVKEYRKNLSDIENAFELSKCILKSRANWNQKNQENWQQWLNSIAEVWEHRISEDKKLASYERRKLEEHLAKMISSREAEPCNKDRNFCCHGAYWHSKPLFEEIKRAIDDDACKIVSFDIFDTLVQRPFFQPRDLFCLLDCYVNEYIPSTDYFVFSNIRVRAEQLARERKRLNFPSWEEITIEEIYEEVAVLCPDLKEYLREIYEKEISLELQYCSIRNSGRELLECAVACGKRVVCVSDMYLSLNVVKKILEKNGFDNISEIYISSKVGLTKATGSLFKYVLKEENIMNSAHMVHIGDNWDSDIVNAKKYGIRAYHLPKAVDIFSNRNESIYSGKYFYKIFHEQKALRSANSAFEMWGIRCMMAVAANRLYDNPFVIYDPDSDFNADAYTIGYLALGMHIYAIADWLAESVRENNYKHLCFMARDGFLPQKAFEEINKIYSLPIETHYLYISRKALLPLMLIQRDTDIYSLYNAFNLQTLSPRKFIEIVSQIVAQDALKKEETILKSYCIPCDASFNSIEAFCKFAQVFLKEFYSQEKVQDYKCKFASYLSDMFQGKTATFDAGYNARCESILSRDFGYDITAHYIHINNDRPFGRILKSGIKLKTLYPYSPFITGIMREQLLSELAPSCIGYEEVDGRLKPKFEQLEINVQTWFTTSTMQNAALEFVQDMIKTFGQDIRYLAYRYNDACTPIEYWLHYPKSADQNIFRGVLFEDDLSLGVGNHKSLVDFWNQEIHRWAAEEYRNNGMINPDYNSYPFIRRWLLIFATNWGEGKSRICYHLRNHPVLLKTSQKTYKGIRGIYRKIRRK